MMEDTGERVIPERMNITNELLIEHIARYHFALPFIQGRVLDFASGSGFGTHILAKKKKKDISEIIGIDIDPEIIAYAKGKYYHPKSSFLIADVTDSKLPEKLGVFDSIVSFETIEHVYKEHRFLRNIYRMLKPGGRLILSTPFGKGRGVPSGSPFHVHQITVDEFQHLFDEFCYQTIDYYVQKGALIEPEQYQSLDYYPLGIVVCKK